MKGDSPGLHQGRGEPFTRALNPTALPQDLQVGDGRLDGGTGPVGGLLNPLHLPSSLILHMSLSKITFEERDPG